MGNFNITKLKPRRTEYIYSAWLLFYAHIYLDQENKRVRETVTRSNAGLYVGILRIISARKMVTVY